MLTRSPRRSLRPARTKSHILCQVLLPRGSACPGNSSFTSRIWETRSARSHISLAILGALASKSHQASSAPFSKGGSEDSCGSPSQSSLTRVTRSLKHPFVSLLDPLRDSRPNAQTLPFTLQQTPNRSSNFAPLLATEESAECFLY